MTILVNLNFSSHKNTLTTIDKWGKEIENTWKSISGSET